MRAEERGWGGTAPGRRSPRINQIRERFVFVTPTWAPRRDACVTGVTKPLRITGTAGEKRDRAAHAPCAMIKSVDKSFDVSCATKIVYSVGRLSLYLFT